MAKGFIAKVVAAWTSAGTATPISRLLNRPPALPDFCAAPVKASVQSLGPIEHTVNGQPALDFPGSQSPTTNGYSAHLRADYGHCRIVLTSDLNKDPQHALLTHCEGREDSFRPSRTTSC